MPLPVIPENARSKDVADAIQSVASDYVGLFNKRAKGEASESDLAQLRETSNFINDLDPIQRAMQAAEEITRTAAMPDHSQGRPTAALDEVGQRGYRTVGSRVVDSDAYRALKSNGEAAATFRDFPIEGSLHHQRTLLTTSTVDTSEAGAWLPVGQPVPPVPRQQRLFVRDLLTQIGTTLNALPYVLESNPTTTEVGATAVVQGTDKPEIEMDFALQIAPVAKIAAWVPATTEIIEDAPALRGYIDTRLAYMLALREEQQLLFGTGTSAQIKGLFSWTGSVTIPNNQTQGSVSDLPAGVGLSIGKVENVDLEADGVCFNPLDFWTAVTTRHSSHFDNGYGGMAPAVLSQISWGLPAIRTRSFASGYYGVGAFRMGGTIADREQTIIRVGNQHASFFTQNKVAILAEERLALLVHRPDAFVYGTV